MKYIYVNEIKIEILEVGLDRSIGHPNDGDEDVGICQKCALGIHPETGELIVLWLFNCMQSATISRYYPQSKEHYAYFFPNGE